MRFSKLLLAVVGAAVLLGALAISASAAHLEYSAQAIKATWTRWNFRGGFGTVECEVVLSGSFHSRTITKTAGSLIGYITAGSVLRCARWGATTNQSSLPWHREYRSFAGELPSITGVSETVTGAEWTLREPVFGVTCTIRREQSSTILTYTVSSGVVTRADVSASGFCASAGNVIIEGSTERVEDGAGHRLTITLM